MNLKKIMIGDHCIVTSSKRFHLSERVESGIPFYRSKEIIQKFKGEVVTECDYIPIDEYANIERQFGAPRVGDLLLTTRGTYGVPYVYKENDCFYFADGNITWFKDFDESLNSKYLYYWFQSYEGYQKVDAIAKGTAQKAVPITTLKQLELYTPIIDLQNKIVNILSAYDNLIENNQKQIKLLEEAAQRLYKEWFVDLRFPGYENIKNVDGVPEGWKLESVGSVIKTVPRTVQIKTKDYLREGTIPIIDQSREFIAGYTNLEDAIVSSEAPVIVFGDHTRILKYIQFPFAKGADGTQLIISNTELMPAPLLYLSLLSVDLSNYHYARHFKYLKEEMIIIPSQEIADTFNNIVEPLFKRVQVLRDINRNCEQARDRLLPKLMNGEIEV